MRTTGTTGMNLGGVHTLADMKARCEEVGECWEWQRGFQNHGKSPAVVHKGKRMNARRLAWMLANGKPVPEGHVVMSTCSNRRCVNPAHMEVMAKQTSMSKLAPKCSTAARSAKIASTRLASSHITPEMRQMAISMDGPAHKAAKVLGIAQSTVSKIRRGRQHGSGNVWGGLMRGAA